MPVSVVDIKLERICIKRTTATNQIPDMILSRGELLLDIAERQLWVGLQDGSREKFRLVSKDTVAFHDVDTLPDITDPIIIYNISKYMSTLYVVPTSEYDGIPATYIIKKDPVDGKYKYVDVNNIGYSLASNKLPQPIGNDEIGNKGYENVLARVDHIHPKGDTISLEDMNNFITSGVIDGYSEIEILDSRTFKIDIKTTFSETGMEEINMAGMMQAIIFG